MICPSSQPLSIRLRTLGGRLYCLIRLPRLGAGARDLVAETTLVASPSAPHLRRFTVYRRLAGPPSHPDGAPEAA